MTATTTARARKAAANARPLPGADLKAAAGAPPKPKAQKPAKAAKAAKQDEPAPQGKDDKPRKAKVVRDTFTIPKTEYAVLEALKQRAARLGRPAKKSEVLRAGVQALAAMGDAAFLASLVEVPALKTGRPAKA